MAAALALGSAALVLSFIPLSLTRVLGVLLGGAATAVAYLARRAALRQGRAVTLANAALAGGAAAVFLSGLIFLSCQACSGDGEVDPSLSGEFQKECGRAFEQARQAQRAGSGAASVKNAPPKSARR